MRDLEYEERDVLITDNDDCYYEVKDDCTILLEVNECDGCGPNAHIIEIRRTYSIPNLVYRAIRHRTECLPINLQNRYGEQWRMRTEADLWKAEELPRKFHEEGKVKQGKSYYYSDDHICEVTDCAGCQPQTGSDNQEDLIPF